MKFFKKLMICAALTSTLMTQSFANSSYTDVKGSGKSSIKVTVNGDYRKFEFCKDKNPASCSPLGSRDYSVTELNELQLKIKNRLIASSAGSALIVTGAVAAFIFGGAVTISAFESLKYSIYAFETGKLAFGAGMMGSSASTVVFAYNSKYNPLYVYKRLESIDDDIINDVDIVVKGGDKEVKEISDYLNAALEEI